MICIGLLGCSERINEVLGLVPFLPFLSIPIPRRASLASHHNPLHPPKPAFAAIISIAGWLTR